MSVKVGDQWTVPLCAICHHNLHTSMDGERLFWAFNGIDPIEKAKELWNEFKDKQSTVSYNLLLPIEQYNIIKMSID